MTTCTAMVRVLPICAAIFLLTAPILMAENAHTNTTAASDTKVGKRSGKVLVINTTNATIKIRARVVKMGYVDESSIPTYTVSYNDATKFVHPKKREASVADVEVGSRALLSYYETNGIMMAMNVICGLPDPESMSRRQDATDGAGTPPKP